MSSVVGQITGAKAFFPLHLAKEIAFRRSFELHDQTRIRRIDYEEANSTCLCIRNDAFDSFCQRSRLVRQLVFGERSDVTEHAVTRALLANLCRREMGRQKNLSRRQVGSEKSVGRQHKMDRSKNVKGRPKVVSQRKRSFIDRSYNFLSKRCRTNAWYIMLRMQTFKSFVMN